MGNARQPGTPLQPKGLDSVKEVNLLKHFMFGFEMKPLLWITPDQPPMTTWVSLREPPRWMSEFLAETLGLPMPETRKAALTLFEHIQSVSTHCTALSRDTLSVCLLVLSPNICMERFRSSNCADGSLSKAAIPFNRSTRMRR